MNSPHRTVVYTDGACSGNPGPGGWGWVIPDGESAFGGAEQTTNQRMELTAVLEAIRSIDGPVHVISDSTYVVNCFRDSWWKGWLKRDWKNSQKKPVANRDLWEPLIELYQQRDATFEWVKGHSGNRWNDRADELAVQGIPQKAAPSEGSSVAVEATQDACWGDETARRSIAVIGHRPPEIGGYAKNEIASSVERRLTEILVAKASMFDDVEVLTGLQLGAEQIAAEAAAAAGIDFRAILAFPDPAARWPEASRRRFDELLDMAADVIIVTSTVPGTSQQAAKAFAAQNRWLQNEAAEAIAIWDGAHKPLGSVVRGFETTFGDDLWILDPSG